MADLMLRLSKDAVGRTIPEYRFKRGLERLNEGIFFDVGARLNMDHPYMEYRQGVYFRDRPDGRKHVCSMDRGLPTGGDLVEVPVWSTIPDIAEVSWDDVSAEELLAQEPPFPMACFHNESLVQIKRQVRGEVILCGWRHTLEKLIAAKIPGIDRSSLEEEFSITLADYVETVELPEDKAEWEDSPDAPEEGKVLEEMGQFEPRPTVVLTGESHVERSSGE